jgi:hypothetical protein
MLAETREAPNVFKQIFVEHWEGFKHVYPRYNTRYYECVPPFTHEVAPSFEGLAL